MNEALYVGEEVGDKTPIPQTTPFEFLTQPKEQPKESWFYKLEAFWFTWKERTHLNVTFYCNTIGNLLR